MKTGKKKSGAHLHNRHRFGPTMTISSSRRRYFILYHYRTLSMVKLLEKVLLASGPLGLISVMSLFSVILALLILLKHF